MKLIIALISITTMICFGSLDTVAKGKDKSQPNILLIITDQQTADAMSCAGNKYLKTPALDKLAEGGIRFTNNYVSQPLCLPFRSSLQTGRYPHEIGAINNGKKIDGKFPMLGKLVGEAGYHCAYIGKWHVGTTAKEAGYDNFIKSGKDHIKTKDALKFLSGKHEQPFFLTVSYMNPHNICELARAHAVGTKLPDGPIGLAPTDLNKLPPLPDNFAIPENEPTVIREIQNKSKVHYPTDNWDELIWRQYLWGYYRLVEKVDNEIGKVLSALKDEGYADNTLIIFTSDHGEGVAKHHWNQKQILYDQATKTPFIINWKGKTSKATYSELVSNALDIPSTILDVAGAGIPKSMRGESLLPIIEGKSPKPRKYVIAETMFAHGSKNLGATGRMIRTEQFKYCIYDNGENREQLFDMKSDPGEVNNLVQNPEYQSVLEKHRKMLQKWADKTEDADFPYYSE